MPQIGELLERIGQAKFISTLGLSNGYWQIPVRPTVRAKTAFWDPVGPL